MKCLTILTKDLNILSRESNNILVNREGYSLLLLVNVEINDTNQDVHSLISRIGRLISEKKILLSNKINEPESIIILPFAHLSEFSSTKKTHVNKILKFLSKELNPFKNTLLVKTQASDGLFANLTLIDSVITTKHHITKSGLTNIMKSLLNIFSQRTIERAIYEAQKQV